MSKHQNDDESETGVYLHMKSFIPIIADDPSSIPHSPSTAYTDTVPRSLTSSLMGSSTGRAQRAYVPSNNWNMKFVSSPRDGSLTTPSYPRSDENRLYTHTHTRWDSITQGVYSSRPSREIDPQSSFVDFRQQQQPRQRVFWIEKRKDASPKRGFWSLNLRRRILNTFQRLRRLWTREPDS
ncbi:hypothetical protein C8R42DRAFT_724833 [Lentinula raphanica]|nr:hypothetical protein C8R42DRAFT_724833 [Lentinula raphanica]